MTTTSLHELVPEEARDSFATALAQHCTTNQAFARVFRDYIDDMLPSTGNWPDKNRMQLIEPPCEEFVLFLLQNGVSPDHIADLLAAYRDADFKEKTREYLKGLLFQFETAFCIGMGAIRWRENSMLPVSVCTCQLCAIEAGINPEDDEEDVRAQRNDVQRKFMAEKTAYSFFAEEERRLNGELVAKVVANNQQ